MFRAIAAVLLVIFCALHPKVHAATSGESLFRFDHAGKQDPADHPAGVFFHVAVAQISKLKAQTTFAAPLPEAENSQFQFTHRIEHSNGDVTWVGHEPRFGARSSAVMTWGAEGAFGSLVTPEGRYQIVTDATGQWLVHLSDPRVDLNFYGEDTPAYELPPGLVLPAAAEKHSPAQKGGNSVIDLMLIHSPELLNKYPGGLLETRVNHLMAITNQSFADSELPVVMRLVAIEQVGYTDANGNFDARNDIVNALLGENVPGLNNLDTLRNTHGADMVIMLRDHDIEVRGNCGIAFIFGDGEELGVPENVLAVNVTGDGWSSWSFCDDWVITHEIGHNLGAQHQRGPPAGTDEGTAFALIVPGRYGTIMGSFGTGHPDRFREVEVFSNPDIFCGGAPCGSNTPGIEANNVATMAANARLTARFRISGSPVSPALPPQSSPDADGDGVVDWDDAFPFDASETQDNDGDGVGNNADAFRNDAAESADTDGDGIGNNADSDDDGDGTPDFLDSLPLDPTETVDSDADGVGNNADAFPFDPSEIRDTDGDGSGNRADEDDDGDGVADLDGDDPVLLVLDVGTNRVLRFDGMTGEYDGVEIFDDGLLTFQSDFALGPNGLLYLLVDSSIRRYDRFTGERIDTLVQSWLDGVNPGLWQGFPNSITRTPFGNLMVSISTTQTVERYNELNGSWQRQGGADFGDEKPPENWEDDLDVIPREIAYGPDGDLYVLESTTGSIMRFDGVVGTRRIDLVAPGNSKLTDARDLIFGPDGKAYVADNADNRVLRVSLPAKGQNPKVFVTAGAGGLDGPRGLAFGPGGDLYVTSFGTGEVLRYDGTTGAFIEVFATGLSEPEDLAFAPRVADAYPLDETRWLQPRIGNWYNPARNGHGIDLQRIGDLLFIVWYTYRLDGTPIWYLAVGEMQGKVWEADLEQYRWDGAKGAVTIVGNARLEFAGRTRATFSWELDGVSGSEPFQLLEFGSGAPARELTGHWFPPADPGWGGTIGTQGEAGSVILYLYDQNGEPTWVLGGATGTPNVVDVLSFNSVTLCPSCKGLPVFSTNAAGTVEFEALSDEEGSLTTDISFPAPVTGVWARDGVTFSRISDKR